MSWIQTLLIKSKTFVVFVVIIALVTITASCSLPSSPEGEPFFLIQFNE